MCAFIIRMGQIPSVSSWYTRLFFRLQVLSYYTSQFYGLLSLIIIDLFDNMKISHIKFNKNCIFVGSLKPNHSYFYIILISLVNFRKSIILKGSMMRECAYFEIRRFYNHFGVFLFKKAILLLLTGMVNITLPLMAVKCDDFNFHIPNFCSWEAIVHLRPPMAFLSTTFKEDYLQFFKVCPFHYTAFAISVKVRIP